MNIQFIVLIGFLFFTNLITLYYLHREKRTKIQKRESIELTEFMGDLLSGEAIVKVSRINPTDVFLRSPRNGRN